MKKGLKIALTVVMIGLAAAITFVDFSSVNRPIEFEKKAHARDTVVINRLIAIKDAEVANGRLDSIKKVKALSEIFGSDFNLLSELFNN